MTGQTGVWLYAICGAGAASSVTGLRGVGSGAVRPVVSGELTAIVSDVSLSDFGEAALRRNLEDLDWVTATARAHHRVIEAAAAAGPVLPMRLATLYHDDAQIHALFHERGDGFRDLLRRLASQREWGIKAYAVPAAQAAGESAKDMSGTAYLNRRRQQIEGGRQSRQQAMAEAQALHEELSGHATQARLYPPQAQQLSGRREPMVLNAAYLVDEKHSDDFAARVAEATQRYRAVQVILTGPWPAYSFTAGQEERAG